MSSAKQVDALLRVVLLYLPTAPARQMLCDIARTALAESGADLKTTAETLVEAIDARGVPPTYAAGEAP